MNEDWFDRFVTAIREDGREMRAISLAAGCGPNYVQQITKNGKRPGVDRFVRILNVLGSASTLYILTGLQMSEDDEAFFRLAASMDPKLKKEALRFFRSLRDASGNKAPDPDPAD